MVLTGMDGSDEIYSATSGRTWMIGGGVSQTEDFDILTGHQGSNDYFDLRRESIDGSWTDAYDTGHAKINNFDDSEDNIVVSGSSSQYEVRKIVNQVTKGNGKKVVSYEFYFEIYNSSSGDLISEVFSSTFGDQTMTSAITDKFIYSNQGPMDLLFPDQDSLTVA